MLLPGFCGAKIAVNVSVHETLGSAGCGPIRRLLMPVRGRLDD